MKSALALLFGLFLFPLISQAQTFSCGSDFVNNPYVDAGPLMSACVAKARGAVDASQFITINIPAGTYYVASTVNFGSASNLLIRTETGAGVCMRNLSDACAIFIATPSNPGPSILDSTSATNLHLERIAIDGNNGPRRAIFAASSADVHAYNSRFHACTSCQFLGVASVRAAQGTGMEFFGDNAVFNYVNFSNNGWGMENATNSWSDGLTVLSSANLIVENSRFMDNSDVDLIVGNAPHMQLFNNTIGNSTNFAFAALMLDNFNNSDPNQEGNFSYASVNANTISCGDGKCGIGINLGPQLWYGSIAINGYAAGITNNVVIGAEQGILNGHANGFNILNNTIVAQGAYDSGAGCIANPLSATAGDSVLMQGNNYNPFPNQLLGCAANVPQTLSSLVVHLPNVTLAVSRLYRQVLGRNPDQGGGVAFTNAMNSGLSLAAARMSMAQSAESQAHIDQAYVDILGRHADAGGLKTFMTAIGNGSMTLAQLRPVLAMSAEGTSQPYRSYANVLNW